MLKDEFGIFQCFLIISESHEKNKNQQGVKFVSRDILALVPTGDGK